VCAIRDRSKAVSGTVVDDSAYLFRVNLFESLKERCLLASLSSSGFKIRSTHRLHLRLFSEQVLIIPLGFVTSITVKECAYCAKRNESLSVIQICLGLCNCFHGRNNLIAEK